MSLMLDKLVSWITNIYNRALIYIVVVFMNYDTISQTVNKYTISSPYIATTVCLLLILAVLSSLAHRFPASVARSLQVPLFHPLLICILDMIGLRHDLIE